MNVFRDYAIYCPTSRCFPTNTKFGENKATIRGIETTITDVLLFLLCGILVETLKRWNLDEEEIGFSKFKQASDE
jgi:hypothetical protein